MTGIIKWLTRGSRTTPKYKMIDNMLVLTNGDELTRDDLSAEIRAQTCSILVAQRKVTLLNRELKLLRIFPQNEGK